MRIAVFGAGAWGSALAIAFSRRHDIVLWSREPELADALRRTRFNEAYLPGVQLPENIVPTSRLEEAAIDADLHLIVTPLAGLRATTERISACAPGTPLIWACKGLDAESGRLPHEIVEEILGHDAPCGVLTGPSFAAEVACGQPTAITLASRDGAFADSWIQHLHQPLFRIYANDDLVGAEVGGAVKNVMAIAAGVSDGMGFGLNARAALITRGLAEIARLGEALGARRETFMGLAGMGDLILTCTGDLSRNRRVGHALAAGQPLPRILEELGHVAEGVPTAAAVDALAQGRGVDMPISRAVAALLRGDLSPRGAVDALLSREPKQE